MLTNDEETFLAWWPKNSEKQKNSFRPLLTGLSAGLILGISLIVILATGWDERATMVANSKLSSVVFLLAILIISVFMAFLYRKFRWEMQEQRYLELLAKKTRQEKAA
jgi:membrane protein YdbS with pleckstrin-like domain